LKRHPVHLTSQVEGDLIDLFEYIARKDSAANAYHVLDSLDELILSLSHQPERGHYPSELVEHGIKDYREVLFKPYRITYQILSKHVLVLGCFDGRRDMQSLLERRLMR